MVHPMITALSRCTATVGRPHMALRGTLPGCPGEDGKSREGRESGQALPEGDHGWKSTNHARGSPSYRDRRGAAGSGSRMRRVRATQGSVERVK